MTYKLRQKVYDFHVKNLHAKNGLYICDGCIGISSDLPLETNMVVNLEVSIFRLETGALHIEKSFLVTATGCQPLIPQDRVLPRSPKT